MAKTIEGQLQAGSARIAIVVSRFNDLLTGKLLGGAIDAYVRHGGDQKNLTVAYVPGSMELALAAKKLAGGGKYDAVLCLGCVIRGSTDHYEHVAGQAAKAITQVGLDTGVPTIFGVLTCETLEHAIERAGAQQGNYGASSMVTAIEMVNVLKQI